MQAREMRSSFPTRLDNWGQSFTLPVHQPSYKCSEHLQAHHCQGWLVVLQNSLTFAHADIR